MSEPGIVAIIGPSGTGKSTLIRCINRLVDPTSGSIMLGGTDLATLQGKALRQARIFAVVIGTEPVTANMRSRLI